ncbi:3-dehydroquinate synthase [Methylosinus sp. Ce-a6]|uniref:3-dehydroquinate synthase n=1 Tax=Methylosinus sp. Ce-a6 TaxID=2172005 RepID=UPI001FCEBFA4|nr:3-dehydroquinate synthase [Methylosinus sp. Ce-a6]
MSKVHAIGGQMMGGQAAARPGGATPPEDSARAIRGALLGRSLVLVGMMGSGKTSIGQRLAQRLGLPFKDADAEIVAAAAGMSIPDIFAKYGEAHFRDCERRVIARLLAGEPCVLATGGGAFMDETTRNRVKERGVSLWFDAAHDVLLRRVRRKGDRPLLQTSDPAAVLRRLMDERYPVYRQADIAVLSRDVPHEAMVEETVAALHAWAVGAPETTQGFNRFMTSRTPPAAVEPQTVEVGLGDRAYDIVIGAALLEQAGDHIARIAPGAACAVVTDANVARLQLPVLRHSLERSGIRTTSIVVEPGEGSKSFPVFQRVCEEILEARIERRDIVLALGGGVVGDLAGFAAASVRRGSRFVQVPTTLLAQVDSSVGGKTGINTPQGKNLVGAFYQPSLVLADVDALATLPLREFRAGYAEVVKYGLIDDAFFFEWLENNASAVFADRAARVEAISVSCRSKAKIVARDETEQGDRALLNLGHTFGHAFERLVRYDSDRLVHGEGIAIGLVCAFRFSARLGLCSLQDAERVARHLTRVGLPTRIHDIPGWRDDADAVLDAMFQDKKVEKGALTFILARGVGRSFVAKGVDVDAVRGFLKDEIARD